LSIKSFLEPLSILGVALNFLIAFISYPALPDTIPVHFGVYGQPDGWGPKIIIWLMPAVSLWTFLIMSWSAGFKKPGVPLNRAKDEMGRLLVSWLKFEIPWLFAYIELVMVAVALKKADGLGIWFLPIYLVVILGTVLICLFKLIKAKDDGNTTNEK
jgi:uncharacterized membrane protein